MRSLGNLHGRSASRNIATEKDIAMSTHDRMNRRSPAITYPEPIEFTSFDEFIDRVEFAIGGLEGGGVDFITSDPLEFLKSIDPETGPVDLRWLGDLIGRNYERFKDEIATRESDDGVHFLEPTTPTPDPDFIEMTPEDETRFKGDPYDGVNQAMAKLQQVVDRRLPRSAP
jgi:hypothetical protein